MGSESYNDDKKMYSIDVSEAETRVNETKNKAFSAILKVLSAKKRVNVNTKQNKSKGITG